MIIIPIVILYFMSLIGTITTLFKGGLKKNKWIFGAHLIFIIFVLSINLVESEIFKSKVILSGTLKDDLFHYKLVFREDGRCENYIQGFMGYEEKVNGKYKMAGDTIVFIVKPYDNDFIPDSILLDKRQGAIFLNRRENGEFVREKEWLNHFEVRKNLL